MDFDESLDSKPLELLLEFLAFDEPVGASSFAKDIPDVKMRRL